MNMNYYYKLQSRAGLGWLGPTAGLPVRPTALSHAPGQTNSPTDELLDIETHDVESPQPTSRRAI